MDLLIVTLTILTLLGQSLDRLDSNHVSQKRMQNVHAMYVLIIVKLLILYYGWPLAEAFWHQTPWTDNEWESCANAIAVHTAFYLFDLSYRFDPMLAPHHMVAIAGLQLGLAPLQTKSQGAKIGGELMLPFWIPGLIFGDLSIDVSYLLHVGVLKLPKQKLFGKANAVFGLLVRLVQWSMILHALNVNMRGPEMFFAHKLLVATLPLYAYYEFKDAQNGLVKAFRPSTKAKKN